jgi:spore germination cell wall hydrolase CwlJ-like protein
MIRSGQAPWRTVRAGEAIDGAVVVEAIAWDHVMIRSGSTLQRLDFPQVPAAAAPSLAERLAASSAREAIARVAYAEAGGQGDAGLAGVVYTILNRLRDGRWGASVEAVVNAPHQFEPVTRAGGDWRNLPAVSESQRARVDTIINLALDGHLPDLTKGARYFQNPRIVADRARAGTVSPALVNFGGARPSAVIGAHAFYAAAKRD